LIHFKTATHRRVHHDLSGGLDLLQTIERDIVKVAGAVQIPLLVSHYLFEEYITACLLLLLFEKQIVS
jgi:hypothetical protein